MDTEEQEDQKIRTSARDALDKIYGEGKVLINSYKSMFTLYMQIVYYVSIQQATSHVNIMYRKS